MLVWDDKTYTPAIKLGRCCACRGRLSFPFAVLPVDDRGRDKDGIPPAGPFICGECCVDMCNEFSLDMKQVVKARQVMRMGFHGAAKQAAVSGGFVWTNETPEQ